MLCVFVFVCIGLRLFVQHNRLRTSNYNNFIPLLILSVNASYNSEYRSTVWLSADGLAWTVRGSKSDGGTIFFLFFIRNQTRSGTQPATSTMGNGTAYRR
jgi:hypothetical protein